MIVDSLGYSDDIEIPECHQLEVLRRIDENPESDAISWEEAREFIVLKRLL